MPPTPFFAVGSEPTAHDITQFDPLFEAALALIEQQAVGVVWLDPDLLVLSSTGVVPSDLNIGEPISHSMIPLIGLDADLLALKTQKKREPLRLGNTALMTSDGHHSRRFNIAIFWDERRERFLVLLSMIFMQGSPIAELDQEIRRRRLIEQDLASKSLEYARINEQLEEFAYVISHDLNAPLRALRYLSRDIQTALADPSATVDHSALVATAEAIAAQTRRMSQMLTDLLDYARVGRVHQSIASVATHSIVADIVTSLRPTTSIDLIVAGDWPTIDTAAAPLDLVLRNLIENAVKHHDRPNGQVVVSAEQRNRTVVFTITDDGRGITDEWQAAIFEPFRKIDDAHHPESSGIGLALVKKTVMILGGTIEVRSNAPQTRGTAFVVTWPLQLAARDEYETDL